MAKHERARKVVTDTEVVWVPTDEGEEIPLGPPPPLDEEPVPKPKKKKKKKRKKKKGKKSFKKHVKVVYKKRKKERESCIDLFLEDAYEVLIGWWWD